MDLPKVLLLLAIAIGLSDYVARYEISHTPIPAQIAIIDIDALVKKAASLAPGDAKAAEELTAKLRQRAGELSAKGVIVLDSKSVIHAPEEAYVSLD